MKLFMPVTERANFAVLLTKAMIPDNPVDFLHFFAATLLEEPSDRPHNVFGYLVSLVFTKTQNGAANSLLLLTASTELYGTILMHSVLIDKSSVVTALFLAAIYRALVRKKNQYFMSNPLRSGQKDLSSLKAKHESRWHVSVHRQ
jgi:hypothetical protein